MIWDKDNGRWIGSSVLVLSVMPVDRFCYQTLPFTHTPHAQTPASSMASKPQEGNK
jgi:hypothetical protein